MKTKQTLLLIILIFAGCTIFAADSNKFSDDPRSIKLINSKKNIILYIEEGEMISCRTKNATYTGKIDSIGENSIIINGREVQINSIKNIRTKKTKRDNKIQGLLFIGTGITFLIITLILVVLLGKDVIKEASLAVPAAVLTFCIGMILLPIGLISYIYGLLYRYNIKRNWVIKTEIRNK